MCKGSRRALAWAAALLMLAPLGCQKQTDVERVKKERPRITVQVPERGSKPSDVEIVEPATPKTPPRPTEIPKVVLSSRDLETCLIKVGDVAPDGELADLEGAKQNLRGLFGKKATVLLFWTEENPYAVQALENLQGDVAEKYPGQDVRVVGIDLNDSPQVARQAIDDGKVKYANLLDPQGSYLAKFTADAEKLPRVYLLDAQGKVLWFDVEYSDTTERDLNAGIQVTLGGPAQ